MSGRTLWRLLLALSVGLCSALPAWAAPDQRAGLVDPPAVGSLTLGVIAVIVTGLLALVGPCAVEARRRHQGPRARELHRKAVLLAIQPWASGRITAGRRRTRMI
jgi:hypothetical protein